MYPRWIGLDWAWWEQDRGGGGGAGSDSDSPPVAPAPTVETGDDDGDEEPYDKARAMATIVKLRQQVKDGKAARRDLDAAQVRLTELEGRDKSELERAQAAREAAEKARTDTDTRLTTVQQTMRVKLAKQAIKMEAIRQNADDELVASLIDVSAVKFDDDDDDPIGDPDSKDVEKLVKAVIERKPAVLLDSAPVMRNGIPKTPKQADGEVISKEHRDAISRQYQNSY